MVAHVVASPFTAPNRSRSARNARNSRTRAAPAEGASAARASSSPSSPCQKCSSNSRRFDSSSAARRRSASRRAAGSVSAARELLKHGPPIVLAEVAAGERSADAHLLLLADHVDSDAHQPRRPVAGGVEANSGVQQAAPPLGELRLLGQAVRRAANRRPPLSARRLPVDATSGSLAQRGHGPRLHARGRSHRLRSWSRRRASLFAPRGSRFHPSLSYCRQWGRRYTKFLINLWKFRRKGKGG